MSRTLPTECPHGVVLDWGDFGPRHDEDPDDVAAWTGTCEKCESQEYRIALRHQSPGSEELDDIVVNDVEMFRMEQMDRNVWWACCYLAGEDDAGNRLTFDIRYDRQARDIVITATELPIGVRYEHECPEEDSGV